MKNLRKLTASGLYIFTLIYRVAPEYLLWSVLGCATDAVLPLLYVYAPKLILQALTDGVVFAQVLRTVLLYGAVLLCLNLSRTFFTGKAALSADIFAKKLRYDIGVFTMSLPLSDVERASTAETVSLANNAASVTETVSNIVKLVSNAVTVAGFAWLIAHLDILCLLSVLAVACVKTVFTFIQYRYNKSARLLYAKNDRAGNYLNGLAYFNHGAEKELRAGNLQNWFMNKIKAYRGEMVTLQYRDFGYSALFEAVLAVVSALQSFLVLFVLTNNYLDGIIGIADFTMLFAAVASLTAALSQFGERISQYSRQAMNADDYKSLMSLRENSRGNTKTEPAARTPDGVGDIEEIGFEHVCFTYPDTEKPVLSDVDVTISKGEKLVIVGLNGAGKSTFIKLLCKFYKPTSGRITLNGTDIWDIPNASYYSLLAAVFQDFTNLDFTMRENIAMSEEAGNEKISAILRELGMDAYADKTDTYLSKTFSQDGIEPSGGEAQKLAIARAVYKDAALLILDEPTASLDVLSESEIYENFFRLSKDKTTVFISHRLACSKLADRIAVFADGKIAEYGDHASLMSKGGLYREMYDRQSKPYVSEEAFI